MDNREVAKKTGAPANSISISPREALRWATMDNARALKLEKKIGSIKPGKQADIITINTQDLNLFPVHNPVETVVFQANSSNVDTVIISGRIKKFGGKLRYKDMENKKTLLLRSGRRILRGMNIIY